MGKYGQAAVDAASLVSTNPLVTPRDAWNLATTEIFGKGTSSQLKGCPRSTFLGLCEEGYIKGVAPGNNHLKSTKNKEYGIKAVALLKKDPSLVEDVSQLWYKVVEGEVKVHNSQMDIVVTLWNSNLLV
ncbi:hypothetical protein V7124_08790 [Neobacillus niacini]|uniref:DUF6979 family protein n=1 Tax=Neobacillus niacini TaxID=86668 RepID=UPI002FFDC9A8